MIGSRNQQNYSNQWNVSREDGFTLVELMIAMTVFLVVVTITSSLFLLALRGQVRIVENQNILDNLRFGTEKIARAARISEILNADGPATSTLQLDHPDLGPVTYTLASNRIQETVGGDTIFLTAESIIISRLSFIVSRPANTQPRVTIIIQADSADVRPEARTPIDLQTTVSSRNF